MINIKDVAFELYNTIKVQFFTLLHVHEPLLNQPTNSNVIFIDGFNEDWFERGLSKYIHKRGIKINLLNFGRQYDSVLHYVDLLDKYIEGNKIRNPILVGYSMGGVIAVTYAQKVGWAKVKKIITINSPLKGTPYAYLFFWIKGARDITPASKVIKNLQNSEIDYKKIICVINKWDEMSPVERSYFKKAKMIRLNIGGHTNSHLTKNLEPIFDKYLK